MASIWDESVSADAVGGVDAIERIVSAKIPHFLSGIIEDAFLVIRVRRIVKKINYHFESNRSQVTLARIFHETASRRDSKIN